MDMLPQIILLFLLILDTLQTLYLLRIDIEAEANPIIKMVFRFSKYSGVTVFKIVVGCIMLLFLKGWLLGLAILMYTGIVTWNFKWFSAYKS